MSGTDGGGIALRTSSDDGPEVSDTESGSSYAGSGAPDTPACPYQNTEFFGNECSRYHDCPTHMVERSTIGDNNMNGVATETRSRSMQNEATLPQLNGTTGDRENIGDSGIESNRVEMSTPGQGLVPNTQPPQSGATSLERSAPISSPMEPHVGLDPVAHAPGITLREALHQTTLTPSGLAIGNRISSRPSPNARPLQAGDRSRSAATSSATPPVTQQAAPSLNPIAPSPTSPPERRAAQEITLPRWQPDSDVTYCPICHTQFSFFVRKHHCRKCGRVVCNQCSPHKITIPHQYIVRPPGERAFPRYSFLGDEGGIADFSTLGGGEQVRLCNPCVPDPNTTPPRAQHSANNLSPRSPHQRSQSSSSGHFNGDSSFTRYPAYLAAPNSPDAYARNRSVTMNSSPSSSRLPSTAYPSTQTRILAGTPPAYYPQPYSNYRYPSLLGARFPGASLIDLAGPSSSSSSAAAMNRPLPPPPQIPEEDECPICHRELPSRDLPNFEARRESHIDSCIISHSTYSPGPDSSGRSGSHGTPPPRIVRRTGMFPYDATEKDCVDSAECTICLEEFEVGVRMARLECLCRFHKSCIDAWFRNHPGRCPVHQHDSFGY
ncbi:hypothetical protein AAE478_000249 [Parahypoxylon ruwenzoriense]